MMNRIDDLRRQLRSGLVIPAHPLALDTRRDIDEHRQRALSRYYLDAGAGGLAVGVHTTQFQIHYNGMLRPVLELAMEEIRRHETRSGKPIVKVCGLVGHTEQAVREARLGRELGYDTGLLSLSAMRDAANTELWAHCRRVAEIIPLFGFYLQPAVGGRRLDYEFWRGFFAIDNVVAVKVAPFDRYETLHVMRALADSGRASEVALYTGNDDQIVIDLLTSVRFSADPDAPEVRFVGGLLGQWAVWTRTAVNLLERIKRAAADNAPVPRELLEEAVQLTDANAAIFDAANKYRGCIPGIHEVLRRHGLMAHTYCLDPDEVLSPGQAQEIDRVWAAYPQLRDDDFVEANLHRWLA